MGIPQVPDQVKRGPTLALRAVFAGIGRILLSADRPEANVAAAEANAQTSQDQRRPGTGRRQERAGVVPPVQVTSRWRSLDETGNVRMLSAADLNDDHNHRAAAHRRPAVAADRTAAEPAAVALPLPNYDSLSLASIRARLRGLNVSQLRTLLVYENENAERPEVLGMFERRIDKLESAG